MASSSSLPPLLLFTLLFAVLLTSTSSSIADASSSFQLIADAFDLPSANAMSLSENFSDKFSDGVDLDESEVGRRSLFWRAMRYYISYGALSANRIPCPPRSGRSYYTHNCFNARGPVHPYTRGCSAITRCRR